MDNKDLKIVHQFLRHHNFEDTAGALLAEATIKGFQNLEVIKNDGCNIYSYEQLMLHFKTGDWRNFFNLWNCLIPETIKQAKDYKILMLNLHVYFAILPKHRLLQHWYKERDKMELKPVQSTESSNQQAMEVSSFKDLQQEISMTDIEKNMNGSMEHLQKFLNTNGKELETDVQLRPFFALPFIEDPRTEPFLSKIFEKSWVDELMHNLNVYYNNYKQNYSSSKHGGEHSNKCSSEHDFELEKLMEDSIENKTTKNNNVPIIPNDRNIPIFLEENEIKPQETLCSDTKYNLRSRSTQVTLVNFSEEELRSSYFDKNDKKSVQYSQELAVAKFHLSTVNSNYEKLKLRFHKLHADYHKLMSIARILTTALENSVKGETIDFQNMLETCIKIFPDLFKQNIRDSSHCISDLQLMKSYSEMKLVQHSVSDIIPIPPRLLDFKKIKLHLINGSIKTKLLLLQALRRKITCSQLGERDETIHEYISKDLLGLHGQIASYKGKSILPYLLTPEHIIIPHPLQQSTTRLLNTLASFRCGRDYLSFDSTVVDMVFKCLNSTCDNDVDTFTCNMMIAMLQKLSLRKQQRLYMIENGLVEWLIRHLNSQCRVMDSYRLEYATALLMNLSLHKIAQRRASSLASLLISTLIALLLIDHTSVLPYVSGTLNNFLTNHIINEEAKTMKFSSILEEYSKHKTGDIRNNLDHVLKIHKGEITIQIENEDIADNDNEEFDVIENELEDNDPVKNNPGELFGESLLATLYTILQKDTQEKNNTSDTSSFEQLQIESINSNIRNNQQVKNTYYEQESIRYGKSAARLVKKVYDKENKNNTMAYNPLPKAMLNETLLLHESKLDSSSTKDQYLCNNVTSERKNTLFSDVQMGTNSKSFNQKYKQLALTTKSNDTKNDYKNTITDTHTPLNAKMEKFNHINENISTNQFSRIKSEKRFNMNMSSKRKNENSSLESTHLNNKNSSMYNAYEESAVYLYENQTSKGSSKSALTSSMFFEVGDEGVSSVTKKLSSIASLYTNNDNKPVHGETLWSQEEADQKIAFSATRKLPRTPP